MARQVAIYARFSSDKQSDASIEDQVRRCRDHIARTGGDPATAVVFPDYAVSGASLARPGWEALMAEVRGGEISAIVTEDLSRITRDFADAGHVFRELQFLQVPLLGVADGIDTGAAGSLLTFGLKSIIASQYLADLGDKTHRGLEGRFRAGKATGAVPYGYRTERTEAGSEIRIDERQSAVVRDIFRAYADGKSFAAIAADLNARGVDTPRKRSRERGWVPNTIRAMLDREKYVGRWAWNRTQWVKRPGTGERVARDRDPGDVLVDERPELAIISPELWARVRARREAVAGAHRAGRRTKTRRTYPLSGILRCGECEAVLTIYGGSRTRLAYRCADNRNRGTCANRLTVREETARAAVLGHLRRRLRPAAIEYLRDRAAVILAAEGDRQGASFERARRRLADLQDRIARLVASIEDGTATGAVTQRIVELEGAELQQRRRVAELGRDARSVTLPTVEQLVARVADVGALVDRDPAAARERLRALFDGRIDCYPRDGVYVARATLLPGVLLAENGGWHPSSECHPSESSGGPLVSMGWQDFRQVDEFALVV
jgi:DNA invertase Pin-like site-specific DNA recombinase